jgi:MOSC domain-containing protein YiiM
MQQHYPITIHHLLISPGHNYFGHPKFEPGTHPTFDVDAVEVRAGQGLVGDRFFGKGERFDGHVTFFAWEIFQALRAELAAPDALVRAVRRNVVIEGVPLNGLIGHEFAIDGVRFFGAKHCAPCRWMEEQVAPGALRFLRGRGGLRAQALSDGILHRGPALLTTAHVLDLTTVTQPLPTPRLP